MRLSMSSPCLQTPRIPCASPTRRGPWDSSSAAAPRSCWWCPQRAPRRSQTPSSQQKAWTRDWRRPSLAPAKAAAVAPNQPLSYSMCLSVVTPFLSQLPHTLLPAPCSLSPALVSQHCPFTAPQLKTHADHCSPDHCSPYAAVNTQNSSITGSRSGRSSAAQLGVAAPGMAASTTSHDASLLAPLLLLGHVYSRVAGCNPVDAQLVVPLQHRVGVGVPGRQAGRTAGHV